MLLIVIAIIAVIIMSGMFSMFSGPVNSGSSSQITTSTIRREALPPGSVNETSYFTDELGWISNPTQLTAGLRNFYQQTGVQPHLYITDTVYGSHSPSTAELDDFANELYDALFTDEAHLLLVFFEYNESYMTRYVAGTQAKTVIDSEAADILLDYIDRYYYDESLTDEVYFSTAFNDAADRIMNVERSPWIAVFVVIGLAALALILFVWWRNVKKQKNLEAQQREEMLKTPLEKYGDLEMEKLEKRYEDPDSEPDQ
ncbi:MAG: TPM domain-containing protein [Bacillota bacterium]|nr:TPM domain-containing protein [Bacillota bacterium]